MARMVVLIAGCLAVLAGGAWAQEVVITGFPPGVGGSVDPDFFRPHYPQLQVIADTLRQYPDARAIVTGGADGFEYRVSHDAKNPGLALGRALTLRNLLVDEFGVDPTRIETEAQYCKGEDPLCRFAGVRVVREVKVEDSDLADRVTALENRPPVEKHFTETREVPAPFIENLGLEVSAGFSTSPVGGMPILAGAVTWKRIIFVEAVCGYTVWDDTYRYQGVDLETRRRQAGAMAIVFPLKNIPVGAVAGWLRVEEISQLYYDYVRLSEGPLFGLRGRAFDFLSATVAFHPTRHRYAESILSHTEDDQWLISLMVYKTFGGGK